MQISEIDYLIPRCQLAAAGLDIDAAAQADGAGDALLVRGWLGKLLRVRGWWLYR